MRIRFGFLCWLIGFNLVRVAMRLLPSGMTAEMLSGAIAMLDAETMDRFAGLIHRARMAKPLTPQERADWAHHAMTGE